MQALVVLIIVILVIVLVFQILSFVLQITFASFPAWGAAILLILLTQYLLRVHRVKGLNSYDTLSKMMTVRVEENSNKLNWSLEESQVEPYINKNAAMSIVMSILIGVVSLLIIFPILYRNGNFKGLQFFADKISPQTAQVWGYILSGIIILIILGISNPKKRIEKSITEKVNHLASNANTQLERIDELRLLDNSVKSVASKLKVSFPIDYPREIQRYISTHKVELLLDSAGLSNLIAKNIKQASEDISHLEKALTLYNSAEEFYKKASYEVIKLKTGSRPFVEILEDVYERLNSENVSSLLLMNKWKEYDDVMNTTIEILKDLHEQATNYQDEGYEKERTIYTEETDEEKAYRILGVPFKATNEQIKKMFKNLAAMWHPDRGEDDRRMKDLNWAYDVLKRERNIT